MDITDADSIDKAITLGLTTGSLDACVNSAYPRTPKWGTPFEDLEMVELQENLKLQLGGAIICPNDDETFVAQGYGNFIHLFSIMGVVPPKFENYEGINDFTYRVHCY